MSRKVSISSNGNGARCHWCDRPLEPTGKNSLLTATRDHATPKSLGGTKLVWCCWVCNQLKADKTPVEWMAFMFANPKWWELPVSPPNHGAAGAQLKAGFR